MIQIAATYWPLTEGGGLQHCLGGSTEAFNVGPTLLLPLIQLRTDNSNTKPCLYKGNHLHMVKKTGYFHIGFNVYILPKFS